MFVGFLYIWLVLLCPTFIFFPEKEYMSEKVLCLNKLPHDIPIQLTVNHSFVRHLIILSQHSSSQSSNCAPHQFFVTAFLITWYNALIPLSCFQYYSEFIFIDGGTSICWWMCISLIPLFLCIIMSQFIV